MIFIIKSQRSTSILGGQGGGGGGGLDLSSSLEAKFEARFSQVHQIKFGKFCYYKTQKLRKNHNFGGIWGISEIQRAKFGVFVTYIFGGKVQGLLHDFQWQILGPNPPDLLIWKYPPGY